MAKDSLDKYYKNERDKKSFFVAWTLNSLLLSIDESIDSAHYECINDEEYVIITYSNSTKKQICVTADSLKAITVDVLKHID